MLVKLAFPKGFLRVATTNSIPGASTLNYGIY
jgi:hypothetical protein